MKCEVTQINAVLNSLVADTKKYKRKETFAAKSLMCAILIGNKKYKKPKNLE